MHQPHDGYQRHQAEKSKHGFSTAFGPDRKRKQSNQTGESSDEGRCASLREAAQPVSIAQVSRVAKINTRETGAWISVRMQAHKYFVVALVHEAAGNFIVLREIPGFLRVRTEPSANDKGTAVKEQFDIVGNARDVERTRPIIVTVMLNRKPVPAVTLPLSLHLSPAIWQCDFLPHQILRWRECFNLCEIGFQNFDHGRRIDVRN